VTLVRSSPRGAISRPALDGARLAYAVSRQDGSRIVVRDLAAGRGRVVLRSRRTQLDQPALLGARVLYVQRRACDQRLRVMRLGAPTRTLLRIGSTARRDAGHEHNHTGQGSEPGRCPRGAPPRSATTLWTTALSPRAAFVTLLRASGTAPRATLVRIAR
jgi:hypothetical protein